MVHAMS